MYKVYHHSWNEYPWMKNSYKIYNIKSRGLALLFARLLCFISKDDDTVLVYDSEKLVAEKSCFEKFQICEEVMSCQ